ncbi:MAG: NmrA/HSCARG family protein [Bryobacterales bacterium]|nr:NmrA/HSCARG family protein [Bryobacterales bacterium]
MSDQRVIVVAGATGAQGGGLVRAILAHPEYGYGVRALTRNPASDKAKALAAAGAEVVACDISDETSTKAAFSGGHAAYCVTFFWEHFSPETEILQATNMARAAAAAGMSHVIWSTLEDSRKWIPLDDNRMPTLMGKYKVPHFDAKAEADAVFHEAGVPTTFLLTSFYWDNFIHFGMGPQKQTDGSRSITFPLGDKKLPGIAAEDIGKCALSLLRDPGAWAGKRVGIASEHLTGEEMAAGLSEVVGEPVAYNDVPPDVFRGFGFPGADDLGNMFQFNRDCSDVFCAARDLDFSRSLNPQLLSFQQWAAAHKDALT